MKREFKKYLLTIDPDIALSEKFDDSVSGWFPKDSQAQGLSDWLKTGNILLLAHADDGVIWGSVKNGGLATSHAVLPDLSPELQAATMQQCRLFNSQGELLIWREDAAFQARLILDREAQETEKADLEAFDEDQMLWGTYRDDTIKADGFTVVYEGQGLRHAVPLPLEEVKEDLFGRESEERKRRRPLRLTVRHYVECDKDGFSRITLSRLVGLRAV